MLKYRGKWPIYSGLGIFHPLWIKKKEVNAILMQWPDINHQDNSVHLAINNSLNNLIGYPIDDEERWSEFITVNKEELMELFEEWRLNTGIKNNEAKTTSYFSNPE